MERRPVGRIGSPRPGRRRAPVLLALAVSLVVLSGCSAERVEQWQRGGLPVPASEESSIVGNLWNGAWIAALIVGGITWFLILFAAIYYRRRNDDLPPQTRYNVPIEAFYTIAPVFVIAVLFYWTVVSQNDLLDESAEPDVTIGVVGQQWSWAFNYTDADVYEVGTAVEHPTLVLPVDQVVRFELRSPDVIHSFWVPGFYFKMDVIPGRENLFQLTPNREGTFMGKCAELCGAYHSRMLFNVEVVSQDEYEQYLEELRDAGQTGQIDAPLRGAYDTEPLGPIPPQGRNVGSDQ
ncbi:MAG TPA: cytochrome c oxidase subunit II [Jiangellales bacterium]|nr:cytochrome c oxidase subunit II [Jiangellales bacterium]